VTLALLAVIYLMLFNPMTEKNSYAILAPAFAVAAVGALADRRTRSFGRLLVFAVVSIGVFPELFWRLDKGFGLWWDPLIVGVVGAVLGLRISRAEPTPVAPEPY
jgi:uncharacterized protein YfiM (DUF2279 family)